MTQFEGEQTRRYGQIVARAWADPAFKRRLLADPTVVLQDHGIDLPTGVEARVVEDTGEVVHMIVPLRSDELSAEQLDRVAGGGRVKDPWPDSGVEATL